MNAIRVAIASHPLAWATLVVAWILALLFGNGYGLYLLGGVILLGGGVGALSAPGHPFRAAMIVSIVPLLLAALAAAIGMALGLTSPPEGETVGSYLLELPFWFALFGVPMVLIGMVGGAIVVWARRGGGSTAGMQPR